MISTLRLIALSGFVTIASSSMCQSLNFSGGFTSSTMKEKEDEDNYGSSEFIKTGNISGFNSALGVEFRLGNRLSLETGLKFQTRGYSWKIDWTELYGAYTDFETWEYTLKMNYIDLPVVLNTAVLLGDVRVYTRTGIYTGLLTRAREDLRLNYSSSDGEMESDEYTEILKGEDFESEERVTGGLILGAGVEFKNFFFESNYNFGVYALRDLDYGLFTHDFSLTLGYKIKFKKQQ
jgi:hypothetical protein